MGTVLAAVLGVSFLAGGPAYASGQNCGAAGSYGSGGTSSDGKLCIDVLGSSNVITDIYTFAYVNGSASVFGWSGHVQVTNPTGRTLCNSTEYPLSSGGETLGCHWGGGNVAHATGNYCMTLWIYNSPLNEYFNDGTECLNVFIS